MMQHAQLIAGGHRTNLDCVESPFFEDTENFLLAALLRNQQHSFLGLAEHDFVCCHPSLTLRHTIQFDLNPDPASSAHFAGGASEPGSAHILNANNGAG